MAKNDWAQFNWLRLFPLAAFVDANQNKTKQNDMLSSESSDDEILQTVPKKMEKIDTSIKKKRDLMSPEEILERKKLKKEKRDIKRAERAMAISQEKEKLAKEEAKLHGRQYTVSIALPGSIVDNAQSRELRTYLAGQVARSAAIFNVDEIVIFDDQLSKSNNSGNTKEVRENGRPDCHTFLGRVLQYLETPQYLRKVLFPVHDDLKYAGLLNPLDSPHHMRIDEWKPYREGVVVNRPVQKSSGSLVNCGLRKEVVIDRVLEPGTRLTVKLDESTKDNKKICGIAVPPSQPREQLGLYWGYKTRIAKSLSHIWSECPFKNGYDLTIGTSERGNVCSDDSDFALAPFKHLLIVFGGVAGIEECVVADESLKISSSEAHTLFNMWVNTCPSQGSRTIRTEEAVLISMASLRPHIKSNQGPQECNNS